MPIDKLDLLRRSKEYMESLAAGTDPVSGQELNHTDPMGSERMRRCFAYVASVLGEVILQRESAAALPASGETQVRETKQAKKTGAEPAEEKPAKKRAAKAPFAIDAEGLEAVELTEAPAHLSEMARRLNAAAGLETSDLSSTLLADGLEALGFLEKHEAADGKISRIPTARGLDMGIERLRFLKSGGQPYMVNMLDMDGQRYLLDHLADVLEEGRQIRGRKEAQKAVRKAEKLAEKARAAMEEAKKILPEEVETQKDETEDLK